MSVGEGAPRHPIGVVSTRTGLPQDVLRAWERRYGAVTPHRTETGRRLYTDGDLEKLRLLRMVVNSGRRISDVAGLTSGELRLLANEDLEQSPVQPKTPQTAPDGEARQFVEDGLAAIEKLDGAALEEVLARASLVMSPASLRRNLIRPLMHATGERWREGSFRIMNERLATTVVRSFLGAARLGQRAPEGAQCVVVATPRGEHHELGALLAANAAMEVGWEVIYLGSDLPADEIAAVTRSKHAKAIAIGITSQAVDSFLDRELHELRRLAGDEIAIVVGGERSAGVEALCRSIGAQVIDDLTSFQNYLAELRPLSNRG